MCRNMLNMQMFKTTIFKSSVLIISGTVIAQILHMAALPIVSRLYSPTEFGLFNIVSAAMATILPLSTLKYEFAILRVKRQHQVGLLVAFCILFSLVVAALVPVGAGLLRNFHWDIAPIWSSWMLFAMLAGGGVFQTSWQVAVRESRHQSMAIAKPLQSIVFNIVAIVGALSGWPTVATLVVGDMVSRFSSSAVALRRTDISDDKTFRRWNAGALWLLLKRYVHYPVFSMPSGVIAAFAASLPIFWLAATFSEDVVGQYGMAWRTVFMPLSMISLALNQVVTGRLSQMVRDNDPNISSYLLRVSAGATAIMALPILFIFLWGNVALTFFLGREWLLAGQMVEAMVPLFLAIFVAGPIGMALAVIGRTDLQLGWDIGRLALLFGVFSAATYWEFLPLNAVLFYSFGMLTASLALLAIAYSVARKAYKL